MRINHSPIQSCFTDFGQGNSEAHHWSPEEDEMLLAGIAAGMRMRAIAREISEELQDRTTGACYDRAAALRQAGQA